ncbi:MAG: ATP-dependent DNA helicase [Thermodesulfobacteriota bacterium]
MRPLTERVAEIFSPDGILAQRLPHFELREGQQRMAMAVARALAPEEGSDSNLLAVEAGTGTGKTLAYLVPAALSGQKVVVSTNTINLQEQILAKEIPFLIEHLVPTLSALCVKGRQNYLCLYRWQQLCAAPQGRLFGSGAELSAIADWLEETSTGDRAELNWLSDDSPLWHKITATTSQCLGSQCPDGAACFVNQLRKKAAKAQLLVVNHHLFFSDLALRRFGHAEVLPRYESVIFDEAHHLENVATRYFGSAMSHYQLTDLAADAEAMAEADLAPRDRTRTVQVARALAVQAEEFLQIFPRERGRFSLPAFTETYRGWAAAREALRGALLSLTAQAEALLPVSEGWGSMVRRCEELLETLENVTDNYDSRHVYWYERREKTVALSASPIEVAAELEGSLYHEVKSAIFTSATLTTAGTFTYFASRLGLPETTETLVVDTPFDYPGRTLLYVPPNPFPEPNQPAYPAATVRTLTDLVQCSNGRALLLFTSISAMHKAADALRTTLPYPLLVQGEAPRSRLLECFTSETHSVLLAVASFWEGVDVPGESLSAVIIDKLPFEVPSDPVIMARIEKMKEEGANPFVEFQIPRAILTLRQGVGRLMRTATDRGLLAILDVRLFTKQYGRLFRQSLPPSPVTRSLAEVQTFFAGT